MSEVIRCASPLGSARVKIVHLSLLDEGEQRYSAKTIRPTLCGIMARKVDDFYDPRYFDDARVCKRCEVRQ